MLFQCIFHSAQAMLYVYAQYFIVRPDFIKEKRIRKTYVTLDQTVIKVFFFFFEIYTSSESWINKLYAGLLG